MEGAGTAANTQDIAAIKEAFEIGVAAMKENTVAMIAIALAGGIVIFGLVNGIYSGINFLRRLSKG